MTKNKLNKKRKSSSTSRGDRHLVHDDVCVLCEKFSPSSSSADHDNVHHSNNSSNNSNSNQRNRTFHSVQDYWFHGANMKQKLSLLQVDKHFVLKQIRSSNLYNPNVSFTKPRSSVSSLSSSSPRPSSSSSSSSPSSSKTTSTSLHHQHHNNDQQQQQQQQQHNSNQNNGSQHQHASATISVNHPSSSSSTSTSSSSSASASSPQKQQQQQQQQQYSISAPVLTNNSLQASSTSKTTSVQSPTTTTASTSNQQSHTTKHRNHHQHSSSGVTTTTTTTTVTTSAVGKSSSSMMLPKGLSSSSSRKPLFGSGGGIGGGKETCLCPACKKRKAIFNLVVKVFEDYIEDLECKSCGKVAPVRSISQLQNISTSLLSSRITNISQLPFGDFLIIKNDKLTVSDAYLKDGGAHFYDIMKKCAEIFPDDAKLQPNESPPPENIHMLINYCTMNSELNIKNIMLKAKKNIRMSEIHGDNESSDEELSDSEDDGGENNDDVDDDSDGEEDEDDDEEDGEIDDDEEYTSGAESGESTSEDDISDHEDIDEVIRHRNSNNNNHNGINMNGIIRSNTHESRLLFQIYLARIFAHNVNVAFRDVVALQAQKELLEECEIDEKMKSSKQQQNKNAKKQKQKAKQQQQQQQKKNASQTTKIPPTGVVSKKEQHREVIPPLDILLHEASSVMMSEEIEDDEWNVVQAKSKLPRQARYSSPHESDDSPQYDSDYLPSRSVSPALSTTSTISIVSSGSVSGSVTTVSSSSTHSNKKKKKKKQKAQEAIAKQIDFDATVADSISNSTRAHTTKELNPDAESFVPYATTMTVTAMTGAPAAATTANNNHQSMMVPSSNAYSFFSDIDFMLNDSYMTPRNRQVDYDDGMYGRGIPPIGYELRSNNNTNKTSEEEHRRRHTIQDSFNPFTLPTFFPLVNRMF